MQTLDTTAGERSGRVIVTDQERRNNYHLWAAYQEGNWEFFGIPRSARVHLHRLDGQHATVIEWEQ